ncbi:MAG: M28 family peptidase [Gemmatimonadota bacterium]
MGGAPTPVRRDQLLANDGELIRRLASHLEALEGERHPVRSPAALEAALEYAAERLRESCGSDGVEDHLFTFGGREHRNVVARLPGDSTRPRILVGAHADTVPGTPGADDNASGVAVLLEMVREVASGWETGLAGRPMVEFAVFNLEERQGWTYRVGSRRLARDREKAGVRYQAALILEMVGFATQREESQRIPLPLRALDLPRTGNFLAAVGDGGSRALLANFRRAAEAAAPQLPLVTVTSPLQGWLIWNTRRSDHASFWDRGWPALLLTDTSFLRNPHYHRSSDTVETLDFPFMAKVVRGVAAAVKVLAAPGGST